MSRALRIGLAILAAAGGCGGLAHADSFGKVVYDAATDELVVTMHYRGTQPNHRFSLKWGHCHAHKHRKSTISVEVLDEQWQDLEQQDYVETTRFALSELACRPARVTLHSAPRFYTAVSLPAAPQPASP